MSCDFLQIIWRDQPQKDPDLRTRPTVDSRGSAEDAVRATCTVCLKLLPDLSRDLAQHRRDLSTDGVDEHIVYDATQAIHVDLALPWPGKGTAVFLGGFSDVAH